MVKSCHGRIVMEEQEEKENVFLIVRYMVSPGANILTTFCRSHQHHDHGLFAIHSTWDYRVQDPEYNDTEKRDIGYMNIKYGIQLCWLNMGVSN